jgi:type II secretory pathway component PulK
MMGQRPTFMNPQSDPSGAALVLAVIAILLLLLITFEVIHTSRVEEFITHNIEVDSRLEAACQGGLEVALAKLREDRQKTEIDSEYDSWAQLIVHSDLRESDIAKDEFLYLEEEDEFSQWTDEEDGVLLTIEVQDESAKFNIYLLMTDDAQKERQRIEQLANVLDRFRDELPEDISYGDGEGLAGGINSFLRRTLDSPDRDSPKAPTKSDRTLTSIFELAYSGGITPELLYDRLDESREIVIPGLFRYLTIWSDMQININTASIATLSGLFENKDSYLAERIVDHRIEHNDETEAGRDDAATTGSFDPNAESDDPTGGAAFTQISDLTEHVDELTQGIFGKIQPFVTVQSSVFTIFVTAELGQVRRTKMYVIRRSPEGFRKLSERLVNFPYYLSRDQLEEADERNAEELGAQY